jgi:AbrB family looped-hinge helix DNA binding protein
MQRLESRATDKGQVTIPAKLRQEFGIRPGGTVRFEAGDGFIKIVPVRSSFLDYFGVVEPINRPEDFDALEEAFERGVAEEVLESMRREASTNE